MAKNNKIQMPSGQGGLTRYFEESTSKILISPAAVIIMSIAIVALVILLHFVGPAFLG